MRYVIEITQTRKLIMEIEADSPEDAETKIWDNLDDADVSDSNTEAERMQDENGTSYVWYRGKWLATSKGVTVPSERCAAEGAAGEGE